MRVSVVNVFAPLVLLRSCLLTTGSAVRVRQQEPLGSQANWPDPLVHENPDRSMPIGVLLFWIDAAHFDERGVIDARTRESAGENALDGARVRGRRRGRLGPRETARSPISV